MKEHFDFGNTDLDILSATLCDKVISAKKPKSAPTKVDPIKRALEYESPIENGFVENQAHTNFATRTLIEESGRAY